MCSSYHTRMQQQLLYDSDIAQFLFLWRVTHYRLLQILEIFPDCSMAYINEQLALGHDVQQMIELLSETKYPQEQTAARSRKVQSAAGFSAAGGGSSSQKGQLGDVAHDDELFGGTSGEPWAPSAEYREQAVQMLCNEFNDLGKRG
jgi:hypothetical protein